MTAAAPIATYEATTLAFGDNGRLPCLYVVVDTRNRPDVAAFLSGWAGCCDTVEIGWRAVARPPAALVGVDMGHRCDARAGSALRLLFDVRRDRPALDQLAETEALVVGTKPYGSFANSLAAYGVAGATVRAVVVAADAALRDLLPAR